MKLSYDDWGRPDGIADTQNDLELALKLFDNWVAARRQEILEGRSGQIEVWQERISQAIGEIGGPVQRWVRASPTRLSIEFGWPDLKEQK